MQKKIKVAIADDHTIMRKGVIELIENFGDFTVILDAVNGNDLISKIESATVKPDVCMLDINMPVMNGYDTAMHIKKTWPGMKILALSMYDNEYNIIRMLRSGAHGYILKETDPQELRRALIDVHERSFYHSDIVTGRLISQLHSGKEFDFSERELQFLRLCCTEMSYKEMSLEMKISPRTVEDYRNTMFEKLHIHSRTGLVIFAMKIGLQA